MSESIDILKAKQVAIVASNPAVSKQTGWPIGFWWSELTHPYVEFTEHGYTVDGHCLPGEMDRGPIGQRTLTKVVEYTVNRETRQI